MGLLTEDEEAWDTRNRPARFFTTDPTTPRSQESDERLRPAVFVGNQALGAAGSTSIGFGLPPAGFVLFIEQISINIAAEAGAPGGDVTASVGLDGEDVLHQLNGVNTANITVTSRIKVPLAIVGTQNQVTNEFSVFSFPTPIIKRDSLVSLTLTLVAAGNTPCVCEATVSGFIVPSTQPV